MIEAFHNQVVRVQHLGFIKKNVDIDLSMYNERSCIGIEIWFFRPPPPNHDSHDQCIVSQS